MLSQQDNERYTRVGKGTPMGELMRRYWHPVAGTSQMMGEDPTMAVRILGEDLVLYRTPDNEFGLIEQRCAHRGVDLLYGIPEKEGIRCCYPRLAVRLQRPVPGAALRADRQHVQGQDHAHRLPGAGVARAHLGLPGAAARAPASPLGRLCMGDQHHEAHPGVHAAVQLAAVRRQRARPDAFRAPARLLRHLDQRSEGPGRGVGEPPAANGRSTT